MDSKRRIWGSTISLAWIAEFVRELVVGRPPGKTLARKSLRPSNIDGSRHGWAILSLLVKRLRQAWPGVGIVFRGGQTPP